MQMKYRGESQLDSEEENPEAGAAERY